MASPPSAGSAREAGRGRPRQVEIDGEPSEVTAPSADMTTRRLDESADDGETDPGARPGASRPSRHPIELLEKARQRRVRDTGSGVLDREADEAVPGRARSDPQPAVGRRVLEGVLDDVRDGFVEEHRIDVHRRGGEVHLERPIADPSAESLEGSADEVVELVDVPLGPERASLDPAEVEEVRHEPVQVLDLAIDRRRALALLVGRRSAPGDERPGGHPDRREWRAEVVGHGLDQRGLQRVTLSRDLGGLCFGSEPVMGERLRELVGRGGEES